MGPVGPEVRLPRGRLLLRLLGVLEGAADLSGIAGSDLLAFGVPVGEEFQSVPHRLGIERRRQP
jgi:hypothetical protein